MVFAQIVPIAFVRTSGVVKAMLARATMPVCVGLYARWGAGKSFMMHLLKVTLDPTALPDGKTSKIVQWFEPGYKKLQKEQLKVAQEAYMIPYGSLLSK